VQVLLLVIEKNRESPRKQQQSHTGERWSAAVVVLDVG
jgi:hypothetical protein